MQIHVISHNGSRHQRMFFNAGNIHILVEYHMHSGTAEARGKLLKCQRHSRTRTASHTDKSQRVVPPPTPPTASSFAFGHAHPSTRLERFKFKFAIKFNHLGFELGLRFLQLLSSCYAATLDVGGVSSSSKAWLIKEEGCGQRLFTLIKWSSNSSCSSWRGVRYGCIHMHTLQMTNIYALLLWSSTSLCSI